MRNPLKRKPPLNDESLDVIQVRAIEELAANQDARSGETEDQWYARQRHTHTILKQNLLLGNLRNNIMARKEFAWAIFRMTCIWLSAVIIIVLLSGTSVLHLDHWVLGALIGSGSINVLSLFNNVAKYLFHVPDAQDAAGELKFPETKTDRVPGDGIDIPPDNHKGGQKAEAG